MKPIEEEIENWVSAHVRGNAPEEMDATRKWGVTLAKRFAQLQKERCIAVIQARLSEILGDAQPRPALRAELQELIDRIKEND
jgi:hypothetical protein